jgi:hypothetical protein
LGNILLFSLNFGFTTQTFTFNASNSMMKKYLDRFNDLFLVVPISLALIVINVIRIFNVSITVDETGYRPEDSYYDLLTEKYPSANNHILNSLIRKFFVETFGYELICIRMGSLFAQFIFLTYSWLLCKLLFKKRGVRIISFIILNIESPLVFNFWGLSRGYALAMAFMTASIYYFLRYREHRKPGLLIVSFAAAILCVLSNFALINYYVTLLTIIPTLFIFSKNKASNKQYIIKETAVALIASIVLTLLIAGPLIKLHGDGELDFLGHSGFLPDTVFSLAKENMFISNGTTPRIYVIAGFVTAFTCIITLYWLYRYLARYTDDMELKSGMVLTLFLVIASAVVITQHYVLKIPYLIDRTALFFVTLFMLQFVYWLYYVSRNKLALNVIYLSAVLCLVSYNFFSNLNFRSAWMWWFNVDDLQVLKRIKAVADRKHQKQNVAVDWYFNATMQYYVTSRYKNDIALTEFRAGPSANDTTFDYYYIAPEKCQKSAITLSGTPPL